MQPTQEVISNAPSLEDLYSIPDFAKKFPHITTEQSLRWQVRHREQNGMGVCCIPYGKKLLISKTLFERWMASRVEAIA